MQETEEKAGRGDHLYESYVESGGESGGAFCSTLKESEKNRRPAAWISIAGGGERKGCSGGSRGSENKNVKLESGRGQRAYTRQFLYT